MSIDSIYSQINLASSLVNEWIMDQIDLMPSLFESRNQLLKLKHDNLQLDDEVKTYQGNQSHHSLRSKSISNRGHSPSDIDSKEKKLLHDLLSKVQDLRTQTETGRITKNSISRSRSRSGSLRIKKPIKVEYRNNWGGDHASCFDPQFA